MKIILPEFKIIKFDNIEKLPLVDLHIEEKNKLNKYYKIFDKIYENKDEIKTGFQFLAYNNSKYWKHVNKFFKLDQNFSNASRKIYEICLKTEFLNFKKKEIKHFDICGAPGGFILGISHFMKKHLKDKIYNWKIQSFISEGYLTDQFNLFKDNPDNVLIYGNGDISNPENIKQYKKFFKNNKVDIVTSDCGVGWESRKGLISKAFLGQFLVMTQALNKGGNFFMKTYELYDNFYIDLIVILSTYFEEAYIVKPESSAQFKGAENYLLGIGYKGGFSTKLFNNLLKLLDNEDIEKYSFFQNGEKSYKDSIIDKVEEMTVSKLKLQYKGLKLMKEVFNLGSSKDIIHKIKDLDKQILKYTFDYAKRMKY